MIQSLESTRGKGSEVVVVVVEVDNSSSGRRRHNIRCSIKSHSKCEGTAVLLLSSCSLFIVRIILPSSYPFQVR